MQQHCVQMALTWHSAFDVHGGCNVAFYVAKAMCNWRRLVTLVTSS